jgi:hypothetical protein
MSPKGEITPVLCDRCNQPATHEYQRVRLRSGSRWPKKRLNRLCTDCATTLRDWLNGVPASRLKPEARPVRPQPKRPQIRAALPRKPVARRPGTLIGTEARKRVIREIDADFRSLKETWNPGLAEGLEERIEELAKDPLLKPFLPDLDDLRSLSPESGRKSSSNGARTGNNSSGATTRRKSCG